MIHSKGLVFPNTKVSDMSGYIGIKKQWRLYELKPYLNQNIYQDEELRSLINENLRKLDKLEKKLEKAKR